MKMYTTIMTRFGDAKQCEDCLTWMMWPQEYISLFFWDRGEDESIKEVCNECAKEYGDDVDGWDIDVAQYRMEDR